MLWREYAMQPVPTPISLTQQPDTLNLGAVQQGLRSGALSLDGQPSQGPALNMVLGAQTNTPNNIGGSGGRTGGSAGGTSTANTQARNTINANYGELTNFLTGQRDNLQTQSNTLAGTVGRQFGAQKGALDTSLQQGKANLSRAREKVQLRGSETLRDLAANIRSAFDAGNIRLGVAGASDSSAAPQFAYALTRLQNQNRADVLRQGNEQLGDIDFEEQNLLTDYNTQLEALRQERDDRLTEIALDFQNKINAINSEITNANLDRRSALADLRVDVANEALQNIATLDSDLSGFVSQMTERAQSILGQMEQARLAQSGANFQPTTQLNLQPADTRLQIGPSAAALGEVNFFRPGRDEE